MSLLFSQDIKDFLSSIENTNTIKSQVNARKDDIAEAKILGRIKNHEDVEIIDQHIKSCIDTRLKKLAAPPQ